MGNDHVFKGCIPAIMTPCNSKGEPDFDALVRKATQLMEAGMQSVVYCGSMGDWPLLTDEQRQEGVLSLTNAGIPVSRYGGPKYIKVFTSLKTCFREWCDWFNDYP